MAECPKIEFKCDKCGEIVFDGEEVKRLEECIENNLY